MANDKLQNLLTQLQPRQNPAQNILGTLGRVSQGIGMGLQGQVMQPQKQETSLRDQLTKTLITEQIKQELEPDTKQVSIVDPATGEIKSVNVPFNSQVVKGFKSPTTDISSPEGLTSKQQLEAAVLSRKVGGVRGMKVLMPIVFEEMRQGKSMDEIEDSLRFASQSEGMTGVLRSASQSIVLGLSEKMQDRTLDLIDDAQQSGDPEKVKAVLKRSVLAQAPVEQKNQLIGSERTITFLDKIQDDLRGLEESGIDTNIFAGTAEEVAKKVGTVNEPKLRQMATRIKAEMSRYRKSMTGVAFNPIENQDYVNMFPSIDKTGAFNSAVIAGLRESLTGNVSNIYGIYMGRDNYDALFGEQPDANVGIPQAPTAQAQQPSQEELMAEAKRRGLLQWQT